LIAADLLPHTATVKVRTGDTAYGPGYLNPFDIPCLFDGQVSMVRNANGEEVVSSSSVWANVSDTVITPGSLITVNGTTSRVITANVVDDGGITGLAYQKLTLE
jgi:hypothetical protein